MYHSFCDAVLILGIGGRWFVQYISLFKDCFVRFELVVVLEFFTFVFIHIFDEGEKIFYNFWYIIFCFYCLKPPFPGSVIGKPDVIFRSFY